MGYFKLCDRLFFNLNIQLSKIPNLIRLKKEKEKDLLCNQSDVEAQKPLSDTERSHQTGIEAPKNAITSRPKPIKTTNSARGVTKTGWTDRNRTK